MSQSATRERIIQVIVQHYSTGGKRKLRVEDAALLAGISRQALSRNYHELIVYIQGKSPFTDLLRSDTENLVDLLAASQYRVIDLEKTLENLKNSQHESFEKMKASYITSLMNSDISLRNSQEVRSTLEKQSLHNEKLIKDIHRLQIELTAEKSRKLSQGSEVSKTIWMEPDLESVFKIFFSSCDQELFEEKKDFEIERLAEKLSKVCTASACNVTLFIDRYLMNFENIMSFVPITKSGISVAVRLPLFNPLEIKMFAKKISKAVAISIIVPVCEVDSIIKAQRKFRFRSTPEIEFLAADMMSYPKISDGYSSVTFYRVNQGD
jgi:hypothetical protein